MTNKQIGGRGKKAPYETTHVRIPIDLKPQIELLIEEFRNNGNIVANKSDVTLEKNDNKTSDDDLIKHHKLLELTIKEFKKNGLYIGEGSKRKHQESLYITEDEAYVKAKSYLDKFRTKKDVVRNLLSCLYGTAVDDSRLD